MNSFLKTKKKKKRPHTFYRNGNSMYFNTTNSKQFLNIQILYSLPVTPACHNME